MTTKRCSDCKQDRPLDLFSKDRSRGDGLAYRCKSCSARRGEVRYLVKRDQHLANSRKNYEAKKSVRAAQITEWQSKNKARRQESARAWREKNRDRVARTNREWAANNRDRCNATVSRRRAALLNATPSWANQFFIDEAYALAKLRTEMLGAKWSVDHIVPLRSKRVCGLHTHDNLRVIPLTHNKAKGNRHWPGMPDA